MARKITPNCVLERPVRTTAPDERALAFLLDAARLPWHQRLALKRRERERRLTAERKRCRGGVANPVLASCLLACHPQSAGPRPGSLDCVGTCQRDSARRRPNRRRDRGDHPL